jgi:hypothetical protein
LSVKGLLFSTHHTCLLSLLIYTDEFGNFESSGIFLCPTSHHLPITDGSFLDA